MFNNFVAFRDLLRLAQKVCREPVKRVARMVASKENRTKSIWSQTDGPPTNFWNIPEVNQRWNEKVSGDPSLSYQHYIARKYLSNKAGLRALSLACGSGGKELRWAKLADFQRIDAFDISEARILRARETAEQEGYADIIRFEVADVYDIRYPEGSYDVIFAEQSLHHFSPLKDILRKMRCLLKPEGILVVNEFVGPTRFQWTDRQLEVINALLAILPDHLTTQWQSTTQKRKVLRPSRLSMILHDPSEAVESSEILPTLKELFEEVERRDCGGTILHMLFSGIAHSFLSNEPSTKRFLSLCFEVEDALLESGEIQSDYILGVYRPRNQSNGV